MTKARNLSALSTVEVGATTDQTKADIDALGINRGRKNLIINGGFDVWQRGTSYSYPNNLTYQCADRWRFQRTASSKVTTPYGNGVRITDNGQGYDMFEQVVEGHPSLFLAGQSYTFSFYVRASTPLSGLTAKMWGNTTNTGVIDENYTATSGWVKHTFTGTVASTLNEGMRVSPAPASINLTSGQWVEFAQVQLELGSVATDFEHRSYGEELALCQRYYQRISGGSDAFTFVGKGQGTTTVDGTIPLTVPLRASPTMNSLNSRAFGDSGTFGTSSSTPTANQFAATNTALAFQCGGFSGLVNNEIYAWGPAANALTIDAEL